MIRLLLLALGLPLAAQTMVAPPAAAPSAAAPAMEWPVLEHWVAEGLQLPLEPGKTDAWIAETRRLLVNEPNLPVEEALSRSFSTVHRLDAEKARRVRSVLSGLPVEELGGRQVIKLRRNTHGLYAFSDKGLDLLRNGVWKNIQPDVREGYGIYEDGDRLLVGDGKSVYEVEGENVTLAFDGIRHFGPFHKHDGVRYLGSGGFMGARSGLFEDAGGGWKLAAGSEEMGATGAMEVLDGKLYIGSTKGLYRKEGDDWKPVAAGLGSMTWIVQHGGKLYGRGVVRHQEGNASWDDYTIYRFDGDTPVPQFDGSKRATWMGNVGGSLLATVAEKVHELLPSGWISVLEGTGGGHHSTVGFGGEAYVQTEAGIYKGVGGLWTKVNERGGWIGEMHEHLGTRWMTSGYGLSKVRGDVMETAFPDLIVHGMAGDGRDLLIGTDKGVQRILFGPEELPADWRERILDQMVRENAANPVPTPAFAAPADGSIRRAGRTIFQRLIGK